MRSLLRSMRLIEAPESISKKSESVWLIVRAPTLALPSIYIGLEVEKVFDREGLAIAVF
jgi:hypothetical protein